MQNEAEELALCIAREGGKPLADARVEVTRAIAGVRIAIAEVSGQHGHVIPLGSEHASSGRRVFTQKFLRGVVLAFSAFNHPLNLIDLNTELDEALKAANLHPHAFQAAVYASNIESINKATPCSMLRQL
jgi:acyl-CoA reductase-like NAD-dependent aldehyde dehydrogenase